MSCKILGCLIVLASSIFITGQAFAQNATVSGQVRNGTGANIQGAELRFILNGTLIASTTTDDAGQYNVELSFGTYRVDILPPAGSLLLARSEGAFTVNNPTEQFTAILVEQRPRRI